MTFSNRRQRKARFSDSLESLETRVLLATQTPFDASPLLARAAEVALPTRRELLRQRFAGSFQGTYTIGPGRYTDQAATIRINASGHTNQSFNSNLQLILMTPIDLNNGRTTGAASVAARNVATSGTTLNIDIDGPPPTGRGGLPLTGTWTVNSSSGGAYSSVGRFGDGSGTITLRYVASGKIPKGASGAGRVVVTLQGSVNTSGVTNPVFGNSETPKHP